MKKFLIILMFIFLICQTSTAQVAGTTVKGQKPDGSFDWIQLDADKKLITSGSGESTSVGTWTIYLPSIASAATYQVVLDTNSTRLLSSIASFTDGDMIMFQGQSAFWWNIGNIASADMQLKAVYADGKSVPERMNLKSTTDMSFKADNSGGIATFVVIVVGQQ